MGIVPFQINAYTIRLFFKKKTKPNQNIFDGEKYNLCLVDRKLHQFTVILDAGNISKCTTVLPIASFEKHTNLHV